MIRAMWFMVYQVVSNVYLTYYSAIWNGENRLFSYLYLKWWRFCRSSWLALGLSVSENSEAKGTRAFWFVASASPLKVQVIHKQKKRGRNWGSLETPVMFSFRYPSHTAPWRVEFCLAGLFALAGGEKIGMDSGWPMQISCESHTSS